MPAFGINLSISYFTRCSGLEGRRPLTHPGKGLCFGKAQFTSYSNWCGSLPNEYSDAYIHLGLRHSCSYRCWLSYQFDAGTMPLLGQKQLNLKISKKLYWVWRTYCNKTHFGDDRHAFCKGTSIYLYNFTTSDKHLIFFILCH